MSSGSSSGGGSGPSPSELAAEEAAAQLNENLTYYLLIISGAVCAAVITWRVTDIAVKYARTIVGANNDNQRYFARPSPNSALAKRHILYAPVLSKRHNREIQLSRALNVGTLPTRFQLLFLAAYFATNVAFCVIDISFSDSFADVASSVRNRSGALAVVNMVPLFVLAGRNNPLIPLLGISFDTYNLIHRWLGRIVALEAITHTLAHWAKGGWGPAIERTFKSESFLWGFIATVAFFAICVQAWSPIRHAFYEFFKMLHIALAILCIVGVWFHLQILGYTSDKIQMRYLIIAISVWCADRFGRFLRLMYYNVGRSRTRTVVEALPGNAVRVTMTVARNWPFRPGQHAYLYMPGISLWQSHPFSVAWYQGVDDVNSDKLLSNVNDRTGMQKAQVSFVIRARTGFTDKLYQKVASTSAGKMEVAGFVEGPYGVRHPLDSYGTVVLFAGGVGVTHQVPYVKDLVAGFRDGVVATRRILLVWTIQTPDHLEWIRPWMTEILAMEKRRDCLRIMLFVSQPRSTKEIHSPSSTVQMFPGRPNVETLLAMEQEQQVGAMAVSVCGPGALSDEVRMAVRRRQSRTNVDFIEEAFSW
jgi:predicted ferric reductase